LQYNSQTTVTLTPFGYGNGTLSGTIPYCGSSFFSNLINNVGEEKYVEEFKKWSDQKERRPRLGKGAKLTKRNPKPIPLWSVLTAQPMVIRKLDRGYTRMRGGKFRHFFKKLKKTTGKKTWA
jgi:hypothetical protein